MTVGDKWLCHPMNCAYASQTTTSIRLVLEYMIVGNEWVCSLVNYVVKSNNGCETSHAPFHWMVQDFTVVTTPGVPKVSYK